MKSLKTCAAILAVLSVSSFAEAARCKQKHCGASKACDCAPTTQPSCCRPTIIRPCGQVYTYQRQVSCLKPPCCDDGCGRGRCGARRGCCPKGCGNGCGNRCGNGNGCGMNGCTNGACGNGAGACCTNGNGNGCGNNCVAATDPGCAAPCDPGCAAPGNNCCDATPDYEACRIAKLIYESQTACYAKCRRDAIRALSKYDCVCHPEIMCAFIYALNDADERVRQAGADAIYAQVRRNSCCCSPAATTALTTALADCDKGVRRSAERALRACGFDIVEPCNPACDTAGACATNCAPMEPVAAPQAAPAPAEEAPAAPEPPKEGEAAPVPAPAPAAGEGPKAFYQKPVPAQNVRPVSHRKSLKSIFGLAN